MALKRTWTQAAADNLGLIAAGVAFYAFLSIVPLLGAVVLTYGIVADPVTVNANVAQLTTIMPAQAATLIGDQLLQVVGTSAGKKGLALVAALAVALYGATKGAGAVVTALNIVYEEKERRGFVAINLLQLGIVTGGVLVALGAIGATALTAFVDDLLARAPAFVPALIRIASYLTLALLAATAAAALFRFGPDRREPRWVWLTPGSVGATVAWIAMTAAFGVYVANFGSYDATYGSLGAIVVMQTWLSLSAYLFLLGAELNAELERQAAPMVPMDALAVVPAATGAASPAKPLLVAVATLAALRLVGRRGLLLIGAAAALGRWQPRR